MSFKAAFASTSRLRAVINLGNPILAARDDASGEPFGVSVDLAREFAKRLDVPLDLVVVDAAGKSVNTIAQGQADIGFFAVDPARAETIAFTAPYILIEGSYLVRDDSPIRTNDQVDVLGRTVVVGKGSAYDLFLTRALQHATIVRSPTSPTVVDTFVDKGADVAAGVRQQLEADARRIALLRVLNGRFMVIRQAMGARRSMPDEAVRYLCDFVEDMKASEFVANALARHGVEGASVAPAGRS